MSLHDAKEERWPKDIRKATLGYEEFESYRNIRRGDLRRGCFIWCAFTLCEADNKLMGNSEPNYPQDWKGLASAALEADLSYSGKYIGKRKLGP